MQHAGCCMKQSPSYGICIITEPALVLEKRKSFLAVQVCNFTRSYRNKLLCILVTWSGELWPRTNKQVIVRSSSKRFFSHHVWRMMSRRCRFGSSENIRTKRNTDDICKIRNWNFRFVDRQWNKTTRFEEVSNLFFSNSLLNAIKI